MVPPNGGARPKYDRIQSLPLLELSVTNQFAVYWALGFMAIYIVAQLAVSNLKMFEGYSRVQKSIVVKLLALGFFVVGYGFAKWLS